MAEVYVNFKTAHTIQSGPLLATVFTPKNRDDLLYFRHLLNKDNPESTIRRHMIHDKQTGVKLSKQQGNAWVNVFNAYAVAACELLAADDSEYGNRNNGWLKVFEAWKEFVNQLIRGYSNNHFPSWTIPCLYVAGKYLRIFAIKADAYDSSSGGFASGFQDDVVSGSDKNSNLEDAARTINRLFTLCLGDR